MDDSDNRSFMGKSISKMHVCSSDDIRKQGPYNKVFRVIITTLSFFLSFGSFPTTEFLFDAQNQLQGNIPCPQYCKLLVIFKLFYAFILFLNFNHKIFYLHNIRNTNYFKNIISWCHQLRYCLSCEMTVITKNSNTLVIYWMKNDPKSIKVQTKFIIWYYTIIIWN